MIIYREVEIKYPLYLVKLDNGVELSVYDTHVESSDGENYQCVEEEIGDDEYRVIGWRKE